MGCDLSTFLVERRQQGSQEMQDKHHDQSEQTVSVYDDDYDRNPTEITSR